MYNDNEFLFCLRPKTDSKYWECPYCKQRGKVEKRFIPYVYARDYGFHRKGEIVDENRFGACFSDKCEAYIMNQHGGIYPSKANGYVYDSFSNQNMKALYQNKTPLYQNNTTDYQDKTPLYQNNTAEFSLLDKKWLENYKCTNSWEQNGVWITREIDLHLNSNNPKDYDCGLVDYLLGNKIAGEKNVTREKVIEMFRQMGVMGGIKRTYRKGTDVITTKGAIYLQEDANGDYRTGKVIYLDDRGHRFKEKSFESYPYFREVEGMKLLFHDWLHNIYAKYKKYKKIDDGEYVLKQCLFGLKRVKSMLSQGRLKGNGVWLYEAEKTAIGMSVFYPEYAHVSVGSAGQFNLDMTSPLQEIGVENIKVFPDKGNYNNWFKTAIKIEEQLNQKSWLEGKGLKPIRIDVRNEVETCEYLKEGDDILDLIDLEY